MAKDTKNTVRKRLSNRDYARLLNYLQYGNDNVDFSNCCPDFLSKIEIRVMRLSKDEKNRMDEFLNKIPTGLSVESFLDSIPKIKKPVAVAQTVTSDVEQEEEPDNNGGHPHWVLQTVRPMTKASLDAMAMIKDAEQGKWTVKGMLEYLRKNVETPGSNESGYLMLEDLTYFDGDFPEEYKRRNDSLYGCIEIAEKKFAEIQKKFNEPEPTDEENFERYKKALTNDIEPIHGDLSIMDEQVSTVAGNKITFDLDGEPFVFEYEKKEDMQNDLIYLEKRGKINATLQVDVFGKKTSVDKILRKIYKKSPDVMPDGRRFYRTFKEAYEDGAISL